MTTRQAKTKSQVTLAYFLYSVVCGLYKGEGNNSNNNLQKY